MNEAQQILHDTRILVAYLIRYVMWATTAESLGQARYDRRSTELDGWLRGSATLTHTPMEWFSALCTRFAVEPCFTLEFPLFSGLRLRWDIAVLRISHAALRAVLDEGPQFFVTFASEALRLPPKDGEKRGEIDKAAEAALFDRTEYIPPENVHTWDPPTDMVYVGRWMSRWVATEPIHHGADDKSGNVATFRAEPICDPLTGAIHHRPVIAGGAWRGGVRDLAFGDALRLLGLTTRDIPSWRAHELLSGGTVEKGADSAGVDTGIRDTIRRLVPMWDLFAGVTRQQIMEGRLHTGDVIVVCRENAWILYDLLRPGAPMEREAILEFAASLPESAALLSVRFGTKHKHADIPESDGTQMIWHDQMLMPGAGLVHTVSLHGINTTTSLQRSALARVLRLFSEHGKIGAKSSRAFGGIAVGPYEPRHGQTSLPDDSEYLTFVRDNAEQIRAFLASDRVKSAPAERKGKKARGAAPPIATELAAAVASDQELLF